MGKLFLKSISKVNFAVLIVGTMVLLQLVNLDSDILTISYINNYIPLILNNIYIWIIYERINRINLVYDKIVCRISKDKLTIGYFFYVVITIILYHILIYGSVILKIGFQSSELRPFLFFLFLNFSSLFIQELISSFMVGNCRLNKIVVIPVLINLIFHYVIIPGLTN